ncbi:MAG: hypothetical protein BZY88_05960 [SAR202 cluster bacterium Io17-Chloro-G9]|nr:MAG: hypothetical protein BZY88_05960 [SAR202 cluster bacterium Io17-Chloro-G9]
MSVYALNKLFYMLENDSSFRDRMKSIPGEAIGRFTLTAEERKALTSGDVGELYRIGVHAFLLSGLSRHRLFGVDSDNYFPRIRGQASP